MFHPGTQNLPQGSSMHGEWQQPVAQQPFPSSPSFPVQQAFPAQQSLQSQQPLPAQQQFSSQQLAFPAQQPFPVQQLQQQAPSPTYSPVPFSQFSRASRNDIVLQVQGLTKAYGQRLAVKGLNLEVRRGEIFGFLGPNGAGKTTTIRMLLNLIKPTMGEVRLFGMPLSKDPQHLLPRVGALIEQPSFQSYLSGRDNLIAVGGYTGGVDLKRVDEVLEIVGLRERGKDHYSTYSLGMKQRLGVGAALLTNPELIILDETGNGLDPAGIVEMRELIFQFDTIRR